LDEALADYGTDLIARDHPNDENSAVSKHDVRTRLHDFKVSQEKTANVKGAILANTFLKFEEYVRLGDGDGKGGYSELKAGRIIAKTMFTRDSGKVARKNVSQNRINRKYWYRYRARSMHHHWLPIFCGHRVSASRNARKMPRKIFNSYTQREVLLL
jgi:hypothetical protein